MNTTKVSEITDDGLLLIYTYVTVMLLNLSKDYIVKCPLSPTRCIPDTDACLFHSHGSLVWSRKLTVLLYFNNLSVKYKQIFNGIRSSKVHRVTVEWFNIFPPGYKQLIYEVSL